LRENDTPQSFWRGRITMFISVDTVLVSKIANACTIARWWSVYHNVQTH